MHLVSRTIGGLVARGLVARQADSADARASRLSHAEAGRSAYASMMRSADSVNEVLLGNLDAGQRSILFSSLDLFAERAERLLELERKRGGA